MKKFLTKLNMFIDVVWNTRRLQKIWAKLSAMLLLSQQPQGRI